MRILIGAGAALLLITLCFAGSISSAGPEMRADVTTLSADASIRADGSVDAGAFIKPEAAQRSLAERSEEQTGPLAGYVVFERRGSRPFSLKSLLCNEPAPPSASVRRAHLHVYRL